MKTRPIPQTKPIRNTFLASASKLDRTDPVLNTSDLIFDNSELLCTKEAALFLRVSAESLRNMVYRKEVRCFKFGRRNRYLKSDLRDLLVQKGGSNGR